MSYIVIDMDGATLDEFDGAEAVKSFIRSSQDDDLAVIEYVDGHRMGAPIFAHDWVARHDDEIFRAALSQAARTFFVGVAPTDRPGETQVSMIDVAVQTVPPKGSDVLARHANSHHYLLAA